MLILKVQDLQKKYGRIKAVDHLDLQVEQGQIFGLLGPNGSGKTTTLGILLEVIKKDGGDFTWFEGKRGSEARKNIGALLETPNFYPFLNAEENLAIIAHIKGKKQKNFQKILDLVQLQDRRKSPVHTYSLGMKQRLAIGAALVGNPEVLILDEPSNGLDPQGIAEIRSTLQEIARSGKTILMASHILDEVEKICSHVAILKKGKLLATGSVGSIISKKLTVEIACQDNEQLRKLLEKIPEVENITLQNEQLVFQIDPSFDLSKINQLAFESGLILSHLNARQKSLESEFLEITR